jgi:hypothetical protein
MAEALGAGAVGRVRRRRILLALMLAATLPAHAGDPVTPPPAPGELLYRAGRLPSGEPLRGLRESGAPLEGQAAACVNCHRRSGLGSYEGTSLIPPIIGRYLFRTRLVNVQDLELPHLSGFTPNLEAYTEESLAEAVRTGHAPGGRTLGYLMPRYALEAPTMAMLIDYLRNLTAGPVPGVSETALHFATIVTPDADPAARDAMLAVIDRFFALQNQAIAGERPAATSGRGPLYRVTRRWSLHPWRLDGAPDTWQRQLAAHLSAEPVFAVISGIGGRSWEPVHRFCEDNALPCLLPNVDLPVAKEQDYYTVYWSRGVLLEAALIAEALATPAAAEGGVPPRRVVQVYRADDIGGAAAHALSAALTARGPVTTERVLAGPAAAGLRKAVDGLGRGDRLVLWLRPADLAALPAAAPAGVAIYASGLLAGLEQARLPPAWHARVHLAYPYDLPEQRRVRMNFPRAWLSIQHLQVADERVQANTLLACQILAETVGHMLDALVRDFLLERVETTIGHHLASGYFPRLGLGAGQRFASKGGYLVRFAGRDGTEVVADGDWTVP